MWKRVLAGGVGVSLAAVGLWYVTRPDPAVLLAELIADLRARGEPTTLAEMDAPMPRDEANGAVDLDAAIAWWHANLPDDDWSTRVPGAWNGMLEHPWQEHASEEQWAALDAFLPTLAPLFEHVDRAVQQPEIVWPRNEITDAASVFGAMTHISVIQELARFLDARSLGGATPEERLRGVRAQLAIGARLRARTMMDVLVAATVHAAASKDLRALLETERLDPIAARAALDELLAEPFDARFSHIVRSERAFALETLPFWIDGSMEEAFGGSTGALSRAAENVGRAFEGKAPKSNPTAADRVGFVRELDHYADPDLTALDVCSEDRPNTWPVNDVARLLPRIRLKLVHTDCVARLARLALSAYAHRAEHGDWPSTAADLAPLFPDGVPLDPFTGAPFVLERDGDHLVLRGSPWGWVIEHQDAAGLREYGHVWRLPPR